MQPANLLDRIMTPFVPAQFECKRLADRLRLKTAWHTDPESLRRDAEDMVRRDMGNFPSEEPFDPDEDEEELMTQEAAMRSLASDIFEGLQETESYSWGLAIAGIVHQWERDTRKIIAQLLPPAPTDLDEADFGKLCGFVCDTGFDIRQSMRFGPLECASLIACEHYKARPRALRSKTAGEKT